MIAANTWVIAGAFAAGIAASSFYWQSYSGGLKAKHQLEKQQAEVVHANQIAALNQRLHTETTQLREKFDEELEETIKQKDDALGRVRNSELRLRDKYAKCQSQSGNGSGAGTATGGPSSNETAVLSRETSEFLVGFASDADKTVAALRTCVAQYERVKLELEQKSKK